MIEYVFRPIDKWPRDFTKERKRRSPFTRKSSSGGYSREGWSFDALMRELSGEVERSGAKRVVIQLALGFGKIRADGLPYADAKPDHPGVIVSFETKHGPVKMPCDQFADWRDNVRAITLTLEHLRGVDRYGVSQHGEQYRGWTALPPGPGAQQAMSGAEAAEFLASHVEFIPASWITERRDAFETAYKIAAKKLHPDAGGDHESFTKLQTAAEVLRRHHGVSE